MQNLRRPLQENFPDQRGLLLARVIAQGLDQRGLVVGERKLDEVFADQAGVGVHDEYLSFGKLKTARPPSPASRGNWVHVFEACLIGISVAFEEVIDDQGEKNASDEDAETPDDDLLVEFGHGLGRLGNQFRPLRLVAVRELLLASDLPGRLLLDGNSQLCGCDARAVGNVLHVAQSRFAPSSK